MPPRKFQISEDLTHGWSELRNNSMRFWVTWVSWFTCTIRLTYMCIVCSFLCAWSRKQWWDVSLVGILLVQDGPGFHLTHVGLSVSACLDTVSYIYQMSTKQDKLCIMIIQHVASKSEQKENKPPEIKAMFGRFPCQRNLKWGRLRFL